MWTSSNLEEIIRTKVSDYMLVAVSNRQPFSHQYRSGKLICQREAGGLVTALNPVLQAIRGTWIAAGRTAQDRQVLNSESKITVPPENPSYALRRIFLTKEEMDGYYYGYSNEGLWPLSHIAYTRPTFNTVDWKSYQAVNEKFAHAILEEVGDRPSFVWIHDYHLTLVAKYLKEAGRTNIITSFFWHIPWPNPEVFRICPQRKEILEAMLAYDLLGFQIRYHCDNFLGSIDLEIESRIDREKVAVCFRDHETLVRAFPISVDFQAISSQASSAATQERSDWIREEFSLSGKRILVGVDRIDYTKGILEKFRGVDRLLEKYPQYKEKFVLFQLGQISRLRLPHYKQLNDNLNALVEEINWKHSSNSWAPIVFTRSYMSYADILALYRIADACLVTSLHDGMNLVAKEFTAARRDLKGVLILSQFTGASRELTDALLINPYDADSVADAIAQALEMPVEEQEKRMRKMREAVELQNVYRWAGKVLSQLLKFEFQEV